MDLKIFFTVGFFMLSIASFAQKGAEDGSKYGHGEDSTACLKNLSLYSEYYKQKNFKEALPYWEKVFNDCPYATTNIYSNGEIMFTNLYKKEKDAAKKEEYYQMLMKVFDQRIKCFGNHPKYPTHYIKGKKALAMYNLKKEDAEEVKKAHALFIEAIKERGIKAQPAILLSFMANSASMYRMEEINAETLIETYTLVSDLLEKQAAANPKKASAYNTYIESAEITLIKTGAADCNKIEELYSSKLEANKDDDGWLKRVIRMFDLNECEDAALLYRASEYLHAIIPSSTSAFGLARMYMKSNEPDRAIEYYKEAIELAEDDQDKAKYYYYAGLVYLSQNKFSSSRNMASEALKINPNWGDAHILVGNAYAASARSFGSNEFEKKTAYWVAVDKYSNAKKVDPSVATKATKLVSDHAKHFPSKEELFFQGLTDGSTYKVGGWINKNTTVRAK